MKETTKLIINRIFSILTGVIAGAIVIGLLEMASHYFYPPPADLDPTNRELFMEHIANMPTNAFLLLIAAHGIGAMFGGFLASAMAKIQKRSAAMFVGLILVLAAVLNLVSIPHPLWFSVVDVLIYTPMALIGNWVRGKIWK